MVMMMMMITMMNCFCDVADRQKVFSIISSWDNCLRSSPSRISDTPWTGFEHAQNLSSGFVEWPCAVVITTTPRYHITAITRRHRSHRGATIMFKSWSIHTYINRGNIIYDIPGQTDSTHQNHCKITTEVCRLNTH